MDLSSLTDNDISSRAEKGYDLTLYHPATGKKLDIIFSLKGTESNTYKKAYDASLDELKAIEEPTQSDYEKAELKLRASIITGWSGIEENEKPIEFNQANVVRVLTGWGWINKQVANALNDKSLFF